MTDTNHAMHPRHDPLCNSSVLGRECDCGLDALTREAEEEQQATQKWKDSEDLELVQARPTILALRRELDEQKALYRHDTQFLSCLGAEDHERANKAESTITAQAERIAKLEEALGTASACFEELIPCTTSGYKPNRLAKRGLELLRAALAPKEGQINGPVNDPGIIEPDIDLSKCPKCGGPADNGHDRCLPPSVNGAEP